MTLFKHPHEIVVDGMRDEKHPGIQYWGRATLQEDGSYRCIANVGGCLYVVEVTITLGTPERSK